MRIGIVCSPTFGGSGVVATELGQALARKGHEVHFISYQRPERLMYIDNVYFHQVSYDPYPFFHYHPYSLALASTMAEVTEEFKLDTSRLYATYFGGDESTPADTEARDIWLKYLPPERVLPFDAKDNFWEMGATGPCGPCTVRIVFVLAVLNH